MPKTSSVHVIDIMKKGKTISKDTSISEALKLLKHGGADFLSVIDDDHKLIGAITETNFIRLVKHEPSSPLGDPVWFDSVDKKDGEQTVEKIMTTNITTITPNDTIETALKVMNSAAYKFLHVIDSERRLVGIIRIVDIFENLLGV